MPLERKRLAQLRYALFTIALVLLMGFFVRETSHFAERSTFWLGASAAVAGFLGQVFWLMQDFEVARQRQAKIRKLEEKAVLEPEKSSYAWDLARLKVEEYFNRNLSQVRNIFYIAAGVMLAGFGFILWGLRLAVVAPERITVAIIGAASGVITQFIGSVTFMVIYRSTMQQAPQFMAVLDRINSIGMAVQILDAIDELSSELKDETRVHIIRLLLAAPSRELSFSPRRRKAKSGDKPDDKAKAARA
jgi:hypothetical protein